MSSKKSIDSNVDLKNEEMSKKQARAFLLWCNNKLRDYPEEIRSFETDFKDGIILHVLISHLAKRIQKKHKAKLNKFEMINIINDALRILAEDKVKLVNISAEDIFDLNVKLILGLIWTLIQHYQIGALKETISVRSSNLTNEDLVKISISETLNIDLKTMNIMIDFNDGIYISGMVESRAPNSIPHWKELDPENAQSNLDNAFTVAEYRLNVPKMMDPVEVCMAKFDKNVLLTYLSSIMTSDDVHPEEAIVKQPQPMEESKSPLIVIEHIYTEEDKEYLTVDDALEVEQENDSPPECEVNDNEENPYDELLTDDKLKFEDVLVEIISFEKTPYVTKSTSGHLLISLNGLNLTNKHGLKFLMKPKEDMDKLSNVLCELNVGSNGIAIVKFFDVHPGLYEARIITDSKMIYHINKDIRVCHKYQRQIKTLVYQTDFYEKCPITMVIDTSDFDIPGFEIQGCVAGDLKILTEICGFLHLYSFIPHLITIYTLKLFMRSNPSQYYAKDFTIKPLAKEMYPYTHSSFISAYQTQSQIIFTLDQDQLEDTRIFAETSLEAGDEIKCELIDSEGISRELKAQALTDSSGFSIDKVLIRPGLYVMQTSFLTNGGAKYYIDPRVIVVESTELKVGVKSKIYIEKTKKVLEIKQKTAGKKDASLTYMIKYKIRCSTEYQVIKFVPKTAGTITITTASSDGSTYEYEYQVTEIDAKSEYLIPGRKFKTKIICEKQDIAIDKLTPYIFDTSFSKSVFRLKKCQGDIMAILKPLKSGIYEVKVADELKKIYYNKKLYCKIEQIFFGGDPIVIYMNNKCISYEDTQIMRIHPDDSMYEVPFTQKLADRGSKVAQFMYTPEITGYVTFVLKHRQTGELISIKTIEVTQPSEKIYAIGEVCSLRFDVKELTKHKPPMECIVKLKSLSDITCEKYETTAKFTQIDTSKVAFQFYPTKTGIFSVKIIGGKDILTKKTKEIYIKNPEFKILKKVSEYFVLLKDFKEFEIFNDVKFRGLSIQASHGTQMMKLEIFATETKQLGFEIPSELKGEIHTLKLMKDEHIILAEIKIDIVIETIGDEKEIVSTETVEGFGTDSQAKIYTKEAMKALKLAGQETTTFTTGSTSIESSGVKRYTTSETRTTTVTETTVCGDGSQTIKTKVEKLPSTITTTTTQTVIGSKGDSKSYQTQEITSEIISVKGEKKEQKRYSKTEMKERKYTPIAAESEITTESKDDIKISQIETQVGQKTICCDETKSISTDTERQYVQLIEESSKSGIKATCESTGKKQTKPITVKVTNPKQIKDFEDSSITVLDSKETVIPSRVCEIDDKICQVDFEAVEDEIYNFVVYRTVVKPKKIIYTYKHGREVEKSQLCELNKEVEVSLEVQKIFSKMTFEEISKYYILFSIIDSIKEEQIIKILERTETLWKVSFIPTKFGQYTFVLKDRRDGTVVGSSMSPYVVQPKSHPKFGKMHLEGCGIERVQVYVMEEILLISEKDLDSSLVKVECDRESVKFTITKSEPKVIRISYTPMCVGVLSITVKVDGQPMEQCPLNVQVIDNYMKKIVPETQFTSYKEIYFYIQKDVEKIGDCIEGILRSESGNVVENEIKFIKYNVILSSSKFKLECFARKPGFHTLQLQNKKTGEFLTGQPIPFYFDPWEITSQGIEIIGSLDDTTVEETYYEFYLSVSEKIKVDDLEFLVKGKKDEIAKISRISQSIIWVYWEAMSTGKYTISLTKPSGQEISGLPKKFEVISKSESKKKPVFSATGNGLFTALANYPNIFQIFSENTATVDVDISIKGEKQIDFQNNTHIINNRSVTTVSYTPPAPGNYTIELLYENKHICSSPLEVFAQEYSGIKGSVKFRLIKKVPYCCGTMHEYLVIYSGQPNPLLDIHIYSLDGEEEIYPKKTKIASGTSTIKFKTTASKKYMIEFTDRGFNVPGSPFYIE